MLYAVVGTHTKIREKAKSELAPLGEVTRRLYVEDIEDLETLIDISSLFGDVSVVECIQLLENASIKERVYDLLERMSESQTIFIIDEPFADVHKVNKLNKYSKKVFDAREEKPKDRDVFDLVDYFLARDKKKAWATWTSLREKHEGEAICGALWWKFIQVWQATLEGKRTAFTKDECEMYGKTLVEASILAHKGEKDINEEIEKLILSL
jgi:tryptophanyl-tRNA synthetase